MNSSMIFRGGMTLLAVLILAAAAERVEAQDAGRVYNLAEVSTPPRVKSDNAAAQAINRSYPEGMRGVGGRVQLRFVVQVNGRVDPESIEIMAASATSLGEAAARAVQQIEFQPGQMNGIAVPTTVMFPITYAAR
jgi:TonB family protein